MPPVQDPSNTSVEPEPRRGDGSHPAFDRVVHGLRLDQEAQEAGPLERRLSGVAYGLITAGIYGLIAPLFFMGAKEKLFYAVPAGIEKMFSGTFVSSVPGTGVAWFLVGLLEAAVVAVMAVSLVRGEFLPSRRKPWLLTSIALGMFAYMVVAFGDTISGTFDGTASLYTYFATTAAVLVLVLLMPPYRPSNWLSSLTNR